jgi:tetratricopeptide (TPR) repeat protein/S1-C subfamily serine protease
MSNPSIAWASLLVLLSTCMPAMAISPAHLKTVGIEGIAQTAPEETLAQIAQRSTVRITTGQNKGSGTIISKRDNTYLILTNSHVVRGAQSIQVQTFDSQTYQAKVVSNAFAKEQDLALLEITSTKSYSVPEIASFSPRLESETLSAGYGASSGKFQSSEGKVQQLPNQALKEGYQLGYSGEVVQGMSGGPVFDGADYKLIGINGRAAFPVVSSYVYEDGTSPSAAEIQAMREVNWSIPIRTVLAQVQPNILTAYQLPLPETDPGVKTTKLAGWLGEIEAKAKQFTVRIDSSSGRNGSGVIVSRQGKTYTVLTAEHVVCEREAATEPCGAVGYKVATHDGKTYELNKSKFRTEVGVDLGVVEFESDVVYPVATLANYNTSKSDYVFVAGFPKVGRNVAPQWMFSGGRIYEKEQGRFNVSDNRIASSSGGGAGLAQSQASFSGGYELVYTSITYGGMSGGVVLDSQGRVIGIHGLAEGESKTEEGPIQLGNSLGVPINTFMGLIPRFKLSAQQIAVTSTKPNPLSQLQNTDIGNAILKVGVSKDNAKPSIWIERGNQLLRLERYIEAEQAFERAIQLNPTFVHLAWYGKGKALEGQSKYPEAVRAFETSLLKQPSYTPALYALSAIYGLLKDYEEALAVINKAIQFAPKNANLYNEKWIVLNNLKRYQEALLAINEAIALSPRAAFYSNRGNTYYDLKDYPKAIADYDKAIAINPEYAVAYSNRGTTYSALKDYPKAIADYDKAIAINPEDAQAYNNRGITYSDLKDYPKAIADYIKFIAINPEDAQAYYNRGALYFALKDYPNAIADYTKFIAINPKYADSYYDRGLTYNALKDYPKAIADYTKFIAIIPEYADVYINRGNTYAALKDYPKAIADYDKAIAINDKAIAIIPEYADAYYDRGLAYYALKDYPKAITDYTKAIAINPEYAKAYSNRGLTYYALKDYPKAIADYDKAIAINPEYADAYNKRGNTYKDLKEYPKAIADYDKAIAINPEDALAYNNRGFTYDNLKNYPKAIADYTKAIAINPEYANAYTNRGNTYNALKEYPKAIADYTKAIAINPEYAAAYYNRGNTYNALKEYPKAISDYDKAIAINPELAAAYYNRGLTYLKLRQNQKAVSDYIQSTKIDSSYIGIYKDYSDLKVFVLLYAVGSKNEGIHTLKANRKDTVLVFESQDTAKSAAIQLTNQNFPTPVVTTIGINEIYTLCHNEALTCEQVPLGTEINLPSTQVPLKERSWKFPNK